MLQSLPEQPQPHVQIGLSGALSVAFPFLRQLASYCPQIVLVYVLIASIM